MSKINRYKKKEPITPIVAESTVVYGVKRDVNECQGGDLRNDIYSAIDGEELLNRLRPRIKSLFK